MVKTVLRDFYFIRLFSKGVTLHLYLYNIFSPTSSFKYSIPYFLIFIYLKNMHIDLLST